MAVVSGGTTLIDNGALDAAVPAGSLILLSTQTASSSASIEFTSGIDSTYDSYVFKYISCHPSVNTGGFFVNFSSDGGSNYNVTKTTTAFIAQHSENDADSSLEYGNAYDLAQSTSDQYLCMNVYTGNDESVSGQIQLFNPSSTTYVKHFISTSNSYFASSRSWQQFVGGYCNTTSVINAVRFKFTTGNIDDGIIKMYGVK